MRYKFVFILTWLILCCFESTAQVGLWEYDVDADTFSVVDQRLMNDDRIHALSDDRDFQYVSGPKSGESWWDRIKRQLYDNLIRPLFDAGARGASQVLMLLLAIGGVALMFFFFFKNRKSTVLDKKDMTWGDVFTNPAEIEEQQFNKWIQSAEQNQDYNEALKYLYLKCIRQMDKKNLLHYRPEYTNRQVLNKLKNKDVKEVFSEVSKQFELVWYGHFTMDAAGYQRLKLLVNKSILAA